MLHNEILFVYLFKPLMVNLMVPIPILIALPEMHFTPILPSSLNSINICSRCHILCVLKTEGHII